MFFLLRMAFWLGVVAVLLPGSGSQTDRPDAQIKASEAVTLASAAVSDARGFCDRQPDACAVGGKVAIALGHKAEAGARTLYEFIVAKLGDGGPNRPAEPSAPATTGSASERKSAHGAMPVSARDMGTLKPADLAPAWHGPVPLPPQPPLRREARANRPSA